MSKKSTIECCVFCHRQENGKPVAVCSKCVQKIICASPAAIANFIEKHKDTLAPEQFYFLNLTSEEIVYEPETREIDRCVDRGRVGKEVRHPGKTERAI